MLLVLKIIPWPQQYKPIDRFDSFQALDMLTVLCIASVQRFPGHTDACVMVILCMSTVHNILVFLITCDCFRLWSLLCGHFMLAITMWLCCIWLSPWLPKGDELLFGSLFSHNRDHFPVHNNKLEQLECLRSEDTPAAPWLPTLLTSSQVKTRQSKSYKFKEFAKTSNFSILKTFLHVTHLKLLDKMCTYEMDPGSTVEDTEQTWFCPWMADGHLCKVLSYTWS